MHPVLSTAELLLAVFQWIPGDQLLAVALVNRSWSEWALDLKWRTGWVPFKALVSLLGTLDLIRLNGKMVYTLAPILPTASTQFYRRSQGVTKLSLLSGFALEDSSVERLKELSCQKGPIFSDQLAHLRISLHIHSTNTASLILAPSLREVDIKLSWPSPTSPTTTTFVETLLSVSTNHLHSIATVIDWPRDPDEQDDGEFYSASPIWEAVSRASSLRHLSLSSRPSSHTRCFWAKRFSRNEKLSFLSLESMTLHGRRIPTSLIHSINATCMPNLRSLEIAEGPMGNADANSLLHHLLTSSPSLEVLALVFQQDLNTVLLRQCLAFGQLHSLSLAWRTNNNVTDADFGRIISSSPAVPTLRLLRLKHPSQGMWMVPLTVASFFSLATYVPHLESLTLSLNAVSFNSKVIRSRPPPFHSMRHLSVTVHLPQPTSDSFARFIASMCPELQSIDIVGVAPNSEVFVGLTELVRNSLAN